MSDLKRIRAIFCGALDIESGVERKAYLDKECGGDLALRAEIETLLTSDSDADNFFSALLPGYEEPQGHILEKIGSVIGRYKLIEKIGEGGMAVVYSALQESPIKRQVAVKIIKLGMDTKSVIARFEAERQALAIMNHPNIARVLDAGATDAGRPYFIMELARGPSITDYCDAGRLNIKKRLNLFLQVCDAVQHAHQKGIIHRDIKPSNVLVTCVDGKPIPKVIDFGIAKATKQRLTERTFFTCQAQLVGTPAYMSPEQAKSSETGIDTRTDIYSLGILLYELLVGVIPFDADKLRNASYSEIQRIVMSEEPVRPSTKLGGLAEPIRRIAEKRRAQAVSLSREIKGDLDWIVMKAIEKGRERRYNSVGDFATDLRRYLENEPISARAPTLRYRMSKLFQRHRLLLTSIIAIAAALIIGFAAGILTYVLDVAIDFENEFYTAQKLYAEGRYQTVKTYIEQNLLGKSSDDKDRLLYAQVLFDLQLMPDAEEQLNELLLDDPEAEIASAAHHKLARYYAERDPVKAQGHLHLANSLISQSADAYATRAIIAGSPKLTIEWLTKALDLDPGHYTARKARALTYYGIRDYPQMLGDVEVLTALRPKDSRSFALRALGRRGNGQFEKALQDFTRAIDLCEIDSEALQLREERVETLWRLGRYEQALDDARYCVKSDPNSTAYLVNLGMIHLKLGQFDQAKTQFRKTRGKRGSIGIPLRALAAYAFDSVSKAETLEMPDDLRKERRLLRLPHYFALCQSLKDRALRLVTGAVSTSSWSPDATELAYARTESWGWGDNALSMSGPASSQYGKLISQIEILNIRTGRTRFLTSRGQSPAWSPDGRYIAFVRGGGVLGREDDAEIWLVASDGGQPRRLAHGGYPGWTDHPTRLYYHSRIDDMVYYIDVNDVESGPVAVAPCTQPFPQVAPNEKYLAYAAAGELTVIDIASGQRIAKWVAPFSTGSCIVRWSPDGAEISLGIFEVMNWSSGLWVYNLEKKMGQHLLGCHSLSCNWSRDRSQVALDIGFPVAEIWLAEVDSTISNPGALRSAQNRAEYLRQHWHHYTNAYTKAPWGSKLKIQHNLMAVGVDQYEHGQYEEALWTLEHNINVCRQRQMEPEVENLAYLAMANEKLGRHRQAYEAFESLHEICIAGSSEEEIHLYNVARMLCRDDPSLLVVWDNILRGELNEALSLLADHSTPKYDGTLTDIDMTVRAGQALARAFWRSALAGRHLGKGIEHEIDCYKKALLADPNSVLCLRNLAHVLSTWPDEAVRDGAKALKHARRACELTQYRDHRCLASMAAAYAEIGDFAPAIRWQRIAIECLPEDRPANQYEKRLRVYQAGKSLHCGNCLPLVAQWPFRENGVERITDLSGNGLHGRIIGDGCVVDDPDRGYVLSLGGTGSFVDFGNDKRFNISDKITVAAWVKWLGDEDEHQAIIGKGPGAWYIGRNMWEYPEVGFRGYGLRIPSDLRTMVSARTSINDGMWHQIVSVYDGSKVYLYIDGKIDVTASGVGNLAFNDQSLCIGAHGDDTEFMWKGLIDDVRIYNSALTRGQIYALYHGAEQELPCNCTPAAPRP